MFAESGVGGFNSLTQLWNDSDLIGMGNRISFFIFIFGVLLIAGCVQTLLKPSNFVEVNKGDYEEFRSGCGWCQVNYPFALSTLSETKETLAMHQKCAGMQRMTIRPKSGTYYVCLAGSEGEGESLDACGYIEEGKYYKELNKSGYYSLAFFSFANGSVDYFLADISCLER